MTVTSFLSSILLCFLSVLCVSCAHPGILFTSGAAIFGWFSYVPVFLLIRRSTPLVAAAWGAVYGFCKFFALMFWLFSYNEPALIGISVAMAGETALVFFLCALVQKKLPHFSWLFMPLVMLAFEFFRTTGELGFSYGVIGYSQWQVIPLVKSARFFGVWGISFVLMLFGSFLADFAIDLFKISICFICIAALLVCGLFTGKTGAKHEQKTLSVALIQPNSDHWKDGVDAYADELISLIELTDKALDENPETQLVVWSETAFVPDVVRHYTTQTDASRAVLARRLLRYINSKSCAFVLGNNHQETDGNDKRNYNSALFFEPGKNVFPPKPVVYNKMRLVPFTEQIPYPYLLSPFSKLFGPDAHYWSAGNEATVFEVNDVRFCTPICFEDTFSSGVSAMCKAGAELIVNLSNDSWSHNLACQNQHLSMAVFRSAENRVPAIRSTASGQTCIIDADGRVVSSLEPFTSGYLCGTVSF
ncbi:MAG: apolipoprotein N-acyltransferase [Treponema sp.]|nr:apolipoprotein N-acyltransferase [Treponema sp.]